MAAAALSQPAVVVGQADGGLFLHTAEPREPSFSVVTAVTRVVAAVAAGLVVVAVVTQVMPTPHFKVVGVVVVVRVMLRSSRMVRPSLGVALHRAGPSTRWQRLVACRHGQRSVVVAEATKTSPTASRNLRQAHRQSPTTSITSQLRDLRRIPRVGRPLAQHKPDHRSRGTCEPSALRLVRRTSSMCER